VEPRQPLLNDPNLPLQPAPPICVETISPSNTVRQREEEHGLYFGTGAKEVWICEPMGRCAFLIVGEKSLIRI